MLILDGSRPDRISELVARQARQDRMAYDRDALPLQRRYQFIAETVLRGSLGTEYTARSAETLDRMWRCPSVYGIRIGKYGLFTTDGTSGIGIPQSSTEWTNAGFNNINAPDHLYLCQQASGNATDAIGSLTLTANATPLYQQSITGWSTKGFGFNQTNGQNFSTAVGTGPDPSATSVLYMGYCTISAPAATRGVYGASFSSTHPLKVNSTSTPRLSYTVNTTTSTGTKDPTGVGLQPITTKYDRTNSVSEYYSIQEFLAPAYSSAVVDGAKGMGNSGGLSFLGSINYFVIWSGSNAEVVKADIKNMYAGLAWNVGNAWSVAHSVALSDNVSVSENIVALVQVTQALTDSVSVAESLTAQVIETQALTDSVSMAESLTAQVIEAQALSDSVAIAESLATGVIETVALTDSMTTVEALTAIVTATQGLSDSAALTEVLVALVSVSQDLTDTYAIIETLTSLVTMTQPIAEAIALFETIHSAAVHLGDLGGTLTAVGNLLGALAVANALGGTITRR